MERDRERKHRHTQRYICKSEKREDTTTAAEALIADRGASACMKDMYNFLHEKPSQIKKKIQRIESPHSVKLNLHSTPL